MYKWQQLRPALRLLSMPMGYCRHGSHHIFDLQCASSAVGHGPYHMLAHLPLRDLMLGSAKVQKPVLITDRTGSIQRTVLRQVCCDASVNLPAVGSHFAAILVSLH